MKLFTLDENYNVVPEHDTIMLVPEFATLWTLVYNKQPRDFNGRKRDRGRKEMVYLYFYCDYRSEYSELSDSERHQAAIDSAGLPEGYNISDELRAAMDRYISLQESPELKLLSSAYGVIERLRIYLDTVEVTDANSKIIIDNLSKMGGLLNGLKKLEEQVRKQHSQDGRIRGDSEKGYLDN